MKKIIRFGVLFLFALFFVVPVFAQETVEEVVITEMADEGVITGEVISLDADAGIITVKTDDGAESTFSVVEGETILWKGIEDIGLSDIVEGEEAEVGYYADEGGNLIASWVDVLVEEGMPPEEIAPLEEADGEEFEEIEE